MRNYSQRLSTHVHPGAASTLRPRIEGDEGVIRGVVATPREKKIRRKSDRVKFARCAREKGGEKREESERERERNDSRRFASR